ncbi:CpXC domain-containing protein [Methanocella sp. MCL-LM]|uniref:CpXC domain-containing protein n=1 Tax=Methanocella sp. MCL-LM TaxID=3412035 RepID=UPI003C74C85C
MSTSDKINMECPECKAAQEMTVWQQINVGTNPELKEELFGWKINVFTCNSCGLKAQLPAALLYHDPGRQFCVQYYPADILGNEDFYALFDARGELLEKTDIGGCEDYGVTPHKVFDMAEMLRYIVFREVAFEKGKPVGNQGP